MHRVVFRRGTREGLSKSAATLWAMAAHDKPWNNVMQHASDCDKMWQLLPTNHVCEQLARACQRLESATSNLSLHEEFQYPRSCRRDISCTGAP
eukprot:2983238-Amphidinium_carterae.1